MTQYRALKDDGTYQYSNSLTELAEFNLIEEYIMVIGWVVL